MAVAKAKRKAPENMSKNRKLTLTMVQIERLIVDAATAGWDTRQRHPNAVANRMNVTWEYHEGVLTPVLDIGTLYSK